MVIGHHTHQSDTATNLEVLALLRRYGIDNTHVVECTVEKFTDKTFHLPWYRFTVIRYALDADGRIYLNQHGSAARLDPEVHEVPYTP